MREGGGYVRGEREGGEGISEGKWEGGAVFCLHMCMKGGCECVHTPSIPTSSLVAPTLHSLFLCTPSPAQIGDLYSSDPNNLQLSSEFWPIADSALHQSSLHTR